MFRREISFDHIWAWAVPMTTEHQLSVHDELNLVQECGVPAELTPFMFET